MTPDDLHDEPHPTYPHKKGNPWDPAAKALAVRALAETKSAPAAALLLQQWATWPNGTPHVSVLRKWASEHSLALVPQHPENAEFAAAAREHRTVRLELAREQLSEVLLDKLSRPAADAIADRIAEIPDIEARIAEARAELAEARLYLALARPTINDDGQLVSPGLGQESVKSAIAMIRDARSHLRAELDQRIHIRDLVGIVTRGVDDHMTLEGLDRRDGDTGDIIVEILIPEARPIDAHAVVVPQHALPERTD